MGFGDQGSFQGPRQTAETLARARRLTLGNFYERKNGQRTCAVCARATARERRIRK